MRQKRVQGQTLAEFALVLPILMLLIVGIFDVGRAIFVWSTISNATREGTRAGAIQPRNQRAIENAVRLRLNVIDPAQVAVTYWYDDGNFGNTFTDPLQIVPGESRVVVQSVYDFRPIVPGFALFWETVPVRFVSARTIIGSGGSAANPPPVPTPPPSTPPTSTPAVPTATPTTFATPTLTATPCATVGVDLIIAVDKSTSMTEAMPGAGSKMEGAKAAINYMIDHIANISPKDANDMPISRVGILAWTSTNSGSSGASPVLQEYPLNNNLTYVKTIVNGITPPAAGDTPGSHAVEKAYQMLAGRSGSNTPMLIYLSDGVANVNNVAVHPSKGTYRYIPTCVSIHPISWTASDVPTNITNLRNSETTQAQYDINCQPRRTNPPNDGYGIPIADFLQSAYNHRNDGPMHTIALGSGSVSFNPQSLSLAAGFTGGTGYTASSMSDLISILNGLAGTVCSP